MSARSRAPIRPRVVVPCIGTVEMVPSKVGTRLMGEATSDGNNMAEDESSALPPQVYLYIACRGGLGLGNNVMARCPHDCLTNH